MISVAYDGDAVKAPPRHMHSSTEARESPNHCSICGLKHWRKHTDANKKYVASIKRHSTCKCFFTSWLLPDSQVDSSFHLQEWKILSWNFRVGCANEGKGDYGASCCCNHGPNCHDVVSQQKPAQQILLCIKNKTISHRQEHNVKPFRHSQHLGQESMAKTQKIT